jgi:hypothetical protein
MDASELRAHLKVSLPEYMIPAAYVMLDALPLTPNGKIDRKALQAPDGQLSIGEYVAPRTPTEDVLAGIWAELLALRRVSVESNFFENGGNSLSMVRMLHRVNAALDANATIVDLFRYSTIRALSEYIDKRPSNNRSLEEVAARAANNLARKRERAAARRAESLSPSGANGESND